MSFDNYRYQELHVFLLQDVLPKAVVDNNSQCQKSEG
jgi:hypothetical protein